MPRWCTQTTMESYGSQLITNIVRQNDLDTWKDMSYDLTVCGSQHALIEATAPYQFWVWLKTAALSILSVTQNYVWFSVSLHG
jgi:hypothetical protein